MINLIPNAQKKQMFKDFYLRLITVFFTMLAVAILTASLAIAPSYYLAHSGGKLVKNSLKIQQEEPVSAIDQDALQKAKDFDQKLSIIEQEKENKYLLSERVINEVLLKRSSEIKLTEISYQSISPRGKVVNISGIAPSREKLLLFRKSFEDNPAFKEVDLPISNFVKGSNIKFYLTLIPS